ncbi:hypothetical protein [Streptomyces sp. NPDC004050]
MVPAKNPVAEVTLRVAVGGKDWKEGAGGGPVHGQAGGLSGLRVLVESNIRLLPVLSLRSTHVGQARRHVVTSLRLRRFVWAEDSCPRKTFAEQVRGLTRRFARRTERLRSTLVPFGFALAGRAGARMSDAFGV